MSGRIAERIVPNPGDSQKKLRLGLCCQFIEHPVKFRTTTAASVGRLDAQERLTRLSQLCFENARALFAALQYCAEHSIGCFRINSQILPLKTHPEVGYSISQLPDGEAIVKALRECGRFARAHQLRTVFHPDQFVVLNSPREDVVQKSIEDIEYQAEVAEWVGADVINIHAGGAYGDKASSLKVLERNLDRLSVNARILLTLENDDRTYTPSDLAPVCLAAGVPLVYDVHHHRCLPDGLSVQQATEAALDTWNREPLFHISSPRLGWDSRERRQHHDYISIADFPAAWREREITVEVEAKAKELAVLKLRDDLANLGLRRPRKKRNATVTI